MPDSSFDAAYRAQYGLVCGTDEAGRGPLCGPVTAAAVVFPPDISLADSGLSALDDSKKLSEKKRESLFEPIKAAALAYGIGECTPQEIDRYNILAASLLAMRRAVDNARAMLRARGIAEEIAVVLLDGNQQTDFGVPSVPVVHGDALSPSIAAASILAKVTRDREMTEIARQYPGYGIEQHKGYPTPAHKLAVYELGAPEIYRQSFLTFLTRDAAKLEEAHQKKIAQAEETR